MTRIIADGEAVESEERHADPHDRPHGDPARRRGGPAALQLLRSRGGRAGGPGGRRHRADPLGEAHLSERGHDRDGSHRESGLLETHLCAARGLRLVSAKLRFGKSKAT